LSIEPTQAPPRPDFHTHRKYIRAFAVMCGHIYGHVHWRVWEDLAALVKAAESYTEPGKGTPDLEALRRSLESAWVAEALLAHAYHFAPEGDHVRLNNVWAVVQAYYVHYHATRALRVARGLPPPDGHTGARAVFADAWADRRVFIPPCSFGVGPRGVRNAPPGIEIDPKLHPWSACDETTCWSLAAMALRTTRNEFVKEREGAIRLKKGGHRLTPAERQAIEGKVRTYTLMDYLWRLRVKANYLDASMFTEAPKGRKRWGKDDSFGLLQDLKDLAANVLLVHEMHVLAKLGRTRFLEIAEGWASEREGPELGLLERLDLLASC
jgi:hypothetical protein